MKKRDESKTKRGFAVVLWLAVFFLAVAPSLVQATETDTDIDGLPDVAEKAGITVTLNSTTPPSVTVPPCTTTGLTGSARQACLDYKTPDVFAIILSAQTGSLLPSDPLAFMKASEPTWGVHYLSSSTTVPNYTTQAVNGRTVYSDTAMTQNALRFTEDNVSDLTSGNLMGVTTWGTPNGYDDTKIYSYRVNEWFTQISTASDVTQVCYSTTSLPLTSSTQSNQCASPTNSTFLQNVWQNIYIKCIMAHEAGHSMKLRGTYDQTVGYHWPTLTPNAFEGAWTSSTAYSTSQEVVDGNSTYICKAAVGAGSSTDPANDQTHWTATGTSWMGTWSSSTAYTPGQEVTISGTTSTYTCALAVGPTTTSPSSDASHWIPEGIPTPPSIMNQFIYFTSKNGTLTWYIGDRYASTDSPKLK
jgi:hypothetical protein